MDGATIICMKQFQKAIDGDIKAFTEIRDMVGEQVVQRIEIDTIPKETYDRVMSVLEEED
jgi:hypothetical protein